MAAEIIRISAVESVAIERADKTVKLSLIVGTVQVLSKHIAPEAARRIGDALGFASNDLQFTEAEEGADRWRGTCDTCAKLSDCDTAHPGSSCRAWERRK